VPLKELQEVWTYTDVMQACAVLDMYSAIETARDGYDKAEADRKAREAEAKANAKRRGAHR
jgi:hypothetical protein